MSCICPNCGHVFVRQLDGRQGFTAEEIAAYDDMGKRFDILHGVVGRIYQMQKTKPQD